MLKQYDLSIYFADQETLSQQGLNEHSNGLFRKDELSKNMDFNTVDQALTSLVAAK
ncbi:hypothetical protein GCM10022378_21940 [Salinicoccus jeotgali]|uniref:Integrase catalytic domain-containing protein n=1 Tax=Salinicoccus jeotgali TaxID=381634 RepID=A0ABP7FA38_9STAP